MPAGELALPRGCIAQLDQNTAHIVRNKHCCWSGTQSRSPACASGGRRLCLGKVGAKGREQEEGDTLSFQLFPQLLYLTLASRGDSFLLTEKFFTCAGCPRQRCLPGASSQCLLASETGVGIAAGRAWLLAFGTVS